MKKISKQRSGQIETTIKPKYDFERIYWAKNETICGIDEVGRGCLAGPVVTAAAILKPHKKYHLLIDSKLLTEQELQKAYKWLQKNALFNVGIHSARIIDTHNIYQATALCMKQAFLHLTTNIVQQPNLIVIDAMPLNLTNTVHASIKTESMIKGESKSASIAAASIIAKVTRDAIITRIGSAFPVYQLNAHKGYCTKLHQHAVKQYQTSIIHRKSYSTNFITDQTNEQQSIFC